MRFIAGLLKRAPSTVSREINRNGGLEGYRASQADQAAWDRAKRPKRRKLADNPTLARMVAGKLQVQWSPEQIAGWLKRAYPGNEDYCVSHETIYRSLFIQARGALKKELLEHLRRTRAMRRSRHHTQKTDNHGRIVDTVSISERPAIVEDRAVPGHWEGDLLSGSGNSHIATLGERQTRYVMLVKIAGKDVRKQNLAQVVGRFAAINFSSKPVAHEYWQIPAVVQVCMGKNDGVDLGRRHRELAPVSQSQLLIALE
jgi:IS30 family transposase